MTTQGTLHTKVEWDTPTLCKRNLAGWLNMTEAATSNMPIVGGSPWGSESAPVGVWCWDETADEVLVGTCPDDAEIVTYADARERFSN